MGVWTEKERLARLNYFWLLDPSLNFMKSSLALLFQFIIPWISESDPREKPWGKVDPPFSILVFKRKFCLKILRFFSVVVSFTCDSEGTFPKIVINLTYPKRSFNAVVKWNMKLKERSKPRPNQNGFNLMNYILVFVVNCINTML